jgi:hypothetical protein
VAAIIARRKRRLTADFGFLTYTAMPRPKVMKAEMRQDAVRMIVIGPIIPGRP